MPLTYYISKEDDTLADFRNKVVFRHFLRNEATIRTTLGDTAGVEIPDRLWRDVLQALRSPAPKHPAEDGFYDKVLSLTFKRKWNMDLKLESNLLNFDLFSTLMPIVASLHEAGNSGDRLSSEVLDIVRMARADKLALSPLQEEYQTYFRELMEQHGLKSIAGGSPEALAAFFGDVKGGWVKGKGRKKSSEKLSVDERAFERAVDKLVSSHLEHAELDDLSGPTQVFVDAVSEAEDRAQGF